MGAREAAKLKDVHVVKLGISVGKIVGAVIVRMFLVSSTSVTETSVNIEREDLEEDGNIKQLYHSELVNDNDGGEATSDVKYDMEADPAV